MDIVDIETICQRIRQLQVQTVARASGCASLSEIWSIIRERLAEACRMREVHTKLRLEHEVLVKSEFGKDSREQFVFLVSQARTLPGIIFLNIFSPSNGGNGIKLNTPRPILTIIAE